MIISALLSSERIFIDCDISSKKKLLEFVADTVSAATDLPKADLFSQLLDREPKTIPTNSESLILIPLTPLAVLPISLTSVSLNLTALSSLVAKMIWLFDGN